MLQNKCGLGDCTNDAVYQYTGSEDMHKYACASHGGYDKDWKKLK